MSHTFRAIWPIRDDTVPARQLAREATEELPELVVRARAQLTGPGWWRVLPSKRVPGSGNLTPLVLVFEAPAEQAPTRVYHRAAS